MCLGHIRGKGFDPVLMVHDFEPHAWMFSSNNELFDGGESILRNEAVVGESVQARARSTEVVWTRSLPFVATAGTDVDVLSRSVEDGDGGQLLPHLALPLRAGDHGVCRPPGYCRDR